MAQSSLESKNTRVLISLAAFLLLVFLVVAISAPLRNGLFSLLFPKQKSKAAGIPFMEKVELATNQGVGDGQGNGWGSHNNRIVRTSNGDIYIAVLVPDPTQPSSLYFRNWKMAKRDHATGQWSLYVPQGAVGTNLFTPPQLLRGPNDELYVFSAQNMLPKLWSSTTNTEVDVPGPTGGWYVNPSVPTTAQEGTHMATGISPSGELYMTKFRAIGCAKSDVPGAYDIAYRNGSGQWTSRTNYINPADIGPNYSTCPAVTVPYEHGRYEYQFLFPSLTRPGQINMVGNLDLTNTAYGWPVPNNNVAYYFDGIGIFNNIDPTTQPVAPILLPIPNHTPTIYHEDGSNDPNVRFYANDVYVDNSGRTHILYDLTGPDTNDVHTGRHAIIQNGVVVKDVQVSIPYLNFGRMTQDSTGRFFIFSMGPGGSSGSTCTMYLQQGADNDTDGTTLLSMQQMALNSTDGSSNDCSSNSAGLSGHFIVSPRSGTPTADYVDGMVSANGGSHIVYYRLQLKGGTVAPTSAPTAIPTANPARATGHITASSETGVTSFNVGDRFNVLVTVQANEGFNAAGATISVSPSLQVNSISAPISAYGPCNFSNSSVNPTQSNPSFASSYTSGLSSTSCTVYTMSVTALGTANTGTVTITNGSVTATSDNAQLFSSATNLTVTINGVAAAATATSAPASPTATPVPGRSGSIDVVPASGRYQIGDSIPVDIVVAGNPTSFNAAQATITVSPNLTIQSVTPAIASHGPCGFTYTKSPSVTDPSFVGAILGGSASNCTAYTINVVANLGGIGTVTVSNGSIKAYSDSSELYASSSNASFIIATGPTSTPTIAPTNTPIPTSSPTIAPTMTPTPRPTNTPTPTIAGVPTNTQTPTPTLPVCIAASYRLGDTNGDGFIDLTDLTNISNDWQKTTGLSAAGSDLNCDGKVDLTDLSILARYYGS